MLTPTLLAHGLDLHGFSLDLNTLEFPSLKFDGLIDGWRLLKLREGMVVEGGSEWILSVRKPMGFFVFSNENVIVRVNPNMRPSVTVQVNSIGVHRYGHEVLHETVFEFLRSFGISIEAQIKIFRQDYNFDFLVSVIELNPKWVVSRSHKRRLVMDADCNVQTMSIGERGKQSVFVRIYDKLAEIEEKKTYWQIPVLEGFGYRRDSGKKVLRVEFEFGGGYLAPYGLRDWAECREKISEFVKKVASSSVRLVVANEHDKAHSFRAENSPLWCVLLDGIGGETSTEFVKYPVLPSYSDLQGRCSDNLLSSAVRLRSVLELEGYPEEWIRAKVESIVNRSVDRNLVEPKKKMLQRGVKTFRGEMAYGN